jgi:AraC-like DNA-binding protein
LSVGLAPMQAVRRQRLREAFERIQTSSISIEAIADELHYYDRASFSRAFRRAFGLYPGSLRSGLQEKGYEVHSGQQPQSPFRS